MAREPRHWSAHPGQTCSPRAASGRGARASRQQSGIAALSASSAPTLCDDLIRAAVADAINAPAPHHTTPWRFVQVKGESRTGLLDQMQQRWRSDLATLDGFDAEAVAACAAGMCCAMPPHW